MPRGDGAGPVALGPMTGRGAGYCAGYPVPGFMNPIAGRGFWGRGRGGGRGWGHWFHATGLPGWHRAAAGWAAYGGPGPYAAPIGPTRTAEQELGALKDHAEYLSDALEGIRRRIEELESEASEEDE